MSSCQLVLSAAIAGNPFFGKTYSNHVLMYSRTEYQLPLIVRETRSFVLPRNPITITANGMGDIKTGLNMIRKPDGCKVVVSFNTLPTGANNWDMCKTQSSMIAVQMEKCACILITPRMQ